MATIGEQLKAAREAKGVSETEAGIQTKILTRLIVAMEKNDFSTIAAPTYAKGFIRIYAEYLGIDPEPLIEEYSSHHRPLAHEHNQPQKNQLPGRNASSNSRRTQITKRHQKNEPPDGEDDVAPEHHYSPHSSHDIRLIAGVIAGLIVLIVLIITISNCSQRRAAENPRSAEAQLKAARKILAEPLPDLYLTEPKTIEDSR